MKLLKFIYLFPSKIIANTMYDPRYMGKKIDSARLSWKSSNAIARFKFKLASLTT